MPPKWAWLLGLVGAAVASPQSNYNLQDLNIEFEEGGGLPEFGTLNGTVTELGKLSSLGSKPFVPKPRSKPEVVPRTLGQTLKSKA